MHPNGICVLVANAKLMLTVPAPSRLATRSALVMSDVKTVAVVASANVIDHLLREALTSRPMTYVVSQCWSFILGLHE